MLVVLVEQQVLVEQVEQVVIILHQPDMVIPIKEEAAVDQNVMLVLG